MTVARPHPALLLIGPTASGKTPLGDLLEERGFRGHRCHHFDFGARLRAAVAPRSERTDPDEADPCGGAAAPSSPSFGLTATEREVAHHALRTGALLTDAQFPVAHKLLQNFLNARNPDTGDLLVLNGLPRHVGQAAMMESVAETLVVIVLRCSTEVVAERIRRDPSGDREGRADDSLEEMARRLDLYERHAPPLMAWYGERGVPIVPLEVRVDSDAEELLRRLEEPWIVLPF